MVAGKEPLLLFNPCPSVAILFLLRPRPDRFAQSFGDNLPNAGDLVPHEVLRRAGLFSVVGTLFPNPNNPQPTWSFAHARGPACLRLMEPEQHSISIS